MDIIFIAHSLWALSIVLPQRGCDIQYFSSSEPTMFMHLHVAPDFQGICVLHLYRPFDHQRHKRMCDFSRCKHCRFPRIVIDRGYLNYQASISKRSRSHEIVPSTKPAYRYQHQLFPCPQVRQELLTILSSTTLRLRQYQWLQIEH